MEVIFEKIKHDIDNNKTTNIENFKILISSIFFPTQINKKLLSKVAIAYTEPNCPCEINNSF